MHHHCHELTMVAFSCFTVPSRLFAPMFNFCFWWTFDKSFNKTTFPLFDEICSHNSFLFALIPIKLETYAFSSSGRALCWGKCWCYTQKSFEIFFRGKANEIHLWNEHTTITYLRYRMVVVHIHAYSCKTITILCCFQININRTPLPKWSSEKKSLLWLKIMFKMHKFIMQKTNQLSMHFEQIE